MKRQQTIKADRFMNWCKIQTDVKNETREDVKLSHKFLTGQLSTDYETCFW